MRPARRASQFRRGPNIRQQAMRIRNAAQAHHRRQLSRSQSRFSRIQERHFQSFILQVMQYEAESGFTGTAGPPSNIGQAIGTVATISLANQRDQGDLSFILAYYSALQQLEEMIRPLLPAASFQWYGAGVAGPAGSFVPMVMSNNEDYVREIARGEGLLFERMDRFSRSLEKWRLTWEKLPPQMRDYWESWPP